MVDIFIHYTYCNLYTNLHHSSAAPCPVFHGKTPPPKGPNPPPCRFYVSLGAFGACWAPDPRLWGRTTVLRGSGGSRQGRTFWAPTCRPSRRSRGHLVADREKGISVTQNVALSENNVPLHPMVLLIIIPTKWL